MTKTELRARLVEIRETAATMKYFADIEDHGRAERTLHYLSDQLVGLSTSLRAELYESGLRNVFDSSPNPYLEQ